jgi:hypothetical protein
MSFVRDTLKRLGLRVQLGHSSGTRCINPKTATNDDFVVLDVHGIHEIGLDYCNCETAQPETVQLLRFRWFPATVANPKTAATFSLLEHFHYQNFESKVAGYEFHSGLARETDNSRVRAGSMDDPLYRETKATGDPGSGNVRQESCVKPAKVCPGVDHFFGCDVDLRSHFRREKVNS